MLLPLSLRTAAGGNASCRRECANAPRRPSLSSAATDGSECGRPLRQSGRPYVKVHCSEEESVSGYHHSALARVLASELSLNCRSFNRPAKNSGLCGQVIGQPASTKAQPSGIRELCPYRPVVDKRDSRLEGSKMHSPPDWEALPTPAHFTM